MAKEMIFKLKNKLAKIIKEDERLEERFKNAEITFEQYIKERYNIDRRIIAVYYIHECNIHNEEFTENQIDLMVDQQPMIGLKYH